MSNGKNFLVFMSVNTSFYLVIALFNPQSFSNYIHNCIICTV